MLHKCDKSQNANETANTYIDLSKNINKSTVVIGRPAECLEHSEPFRAQSIAAGGQLSTQTRNVIQPRRHRAVQNLLESTGRDIHSYIYRKLAILPLFDKPDHFYAVIAGQALSPQKDICRTAAGGFFTS